MSLSKNSSDASGGSDASGRSDASGGATLTVGVVAPASAAPQVELAAGVERLRRAGFGVECHRQCASQRFTFAGHDEERAGALFDFAADPQVGVVWCAGGGYGSARLLPILDRLTLRRGAPPRKLLVGYSDVTALHHYARARWGWATLHAPMPTAPTFSTCDPATWDAIVSFVRGRRPQSPWGDRPLDFLAPCPAAGVRGEVVGGNLVVWNTLTGTPFMPRLDGRQILFFEEVGEKVYAIDRMVTQLAQAGAFDGARAIVLGDFTNCRDDVSQVLPRPSPGDPAGDSPGDSPGAAKAPLRPEIALGDALREIFGRLGLPVASGLPVGHGPNFRPLPLGAEYHLRADGRLELLRWDWAGAPAAP